MKKADIWSLGILICEVLLGDYIDKFSEIEGISQIPIIKRSSLIQ